MQKKTLSLLIGLSLLTSSNTIFAEDRQQTRIYTIPKQPYAPVTSESTMEMGKTYKIPDLPSKPSKSRSLWEPDGIANAIKQFATIDSEATPIGTSWGLDGGKPYIEFDRNERISCEGDLNDINCTYSIRF